MIHRGRFGRTNHLSSRVIFGAAGIADADQDTADRLLPLLLRHGVNHIDTAAVYGDAELRIAPWLRAHPSEFFVATKTVEREGDKARDSLERSLTRMGLDRIDLVQLHNLVEPEEWETAHAAGGALEALLQAREEGLVNYIGVTGHGLRIAGMHLRSLRRHDYDSILLPYSFTLMQIPSYRADVEQLLALCAERDVAVQTIKSIARRRWSPESDIPLEHRQSWYEPLTDPDAISRAVRYVLATPQLFLASPQRAASSPLSWPPQRSSRLPTTAISPTTERRTTSVLCSTATTSSASEQLTPESRPGIPGDGTWERRTSIRKRQQPASRRALGRSGGCTPVQASRPVSERQQKRVGQLSSSGPPQHPAAPEGELHVYDLQLRRLKPGVAATAAHQGTFTAHWSDPLETDTPASELARLVT